MSEQVENANQEAPVDAGVEDAGNLPSAVEEQVNALDKFKIDEEFAASNFKNGKLYGRFDSLEDVLNTLKAVETKHSNVMRDIKNQENVTPPEPEVSLEQVAQPVVSKFIENDFNYEGMDAEIQEIAEASGKSVAEIKLHAIEIKEKISEAYETVGGKEEYVAMQEWANENLSEADQKAYTKELGTPMSKFAIKGLHAEYKNATASQEPTTPTRIEGDGNGKTGARPYGSMAEIARDRAYISGKGKNDAGAKAMYQRRMSLTPDSVIYGR